MTERPGDEQPPQHQPYSPMYPPPGYYAPVVPKHDSAMTALILGIVGLGGGVVCYLPILCAPFAWAIGSRAVREIDASGGHLGGRSEAQAGKILGIIGTALLAVAVLVVVVIIAVVAATA